MTDFHDQVRLDQLDLNLLHVFDVIAREGSLSAAARTLSITQSAVSHALARLRGQLGDPLFVRRGRGVTPTPLARRLTPAIGEAMAVLSRALASRREFAPRLDVPRVTLAVPDELEPMVLPLLHARMSRVVPQIVLASVRIDRARLRGDLWTRKLDVVLDVPQRTPAEVLHEPLFSDAFCVAASRRRSRLDRAAYVAAGHVAVSSRPTGPAMEDFLLSARGVERRVAVRCRRYETALAIAAASDLLLTLPRWQAIHHRAGPPGIPVRLFRAPVPLPPMQVRMYWHRQADDDPAQRWIRDQVRGCLVRRTRAARPGAGPG
ncbi:MAG TPA: LysR family transcriptional regulator [Kofleriaceae bacterium]|nr:LysR family transcriptional regulator [Kofleriaceae bacterium]